jgi:TnpA family transposase
VKLPNYTHEQLINIAQFNLKDVEQIAKCRQSHNRLGFGYQLAFVRLINRFPSQQPFEILEDIVTFVSIQLNISPQVISLYGERQPTISEHQELIRNYLGLQRFAKEAIIRVEQFIFEEASRLERTGVLIIKAEQFLREQKILKPSDDTLRRLIVEKKEEAKSSIFQKIIRASSDEILKKLDELLISQDSRQSFFHTFKQSPGKPSPSSILKLADKLEKIHATGVLEVDISWLNNNFQRVLARYAKYCTADRIRELKSTHRYAVLVCFLWQTYRDTIDFMVDMYDKLVNRIYTNAQNDIDKHNKIIRKKIRTSLVTFKNMAEIILDERIDNSILRQELFNRFGKDDLTNQVEEVDIWLNGKHSHVFNLVKERFSYIRQFLPKFLKYIQIISEGSSNYSLMDAIDILREMNENNKRKLPEDAPADFIPKKIQSLITVDGKLDKPGWECALLTKIRDEIKSGNISVKMSKSFGRFDDFFISESNWHEMRTSFFERACLPCDPQNVPIYLKERLNKSFEQFLEKLPNNTYAKVDKDGWHLSVDTTESLNPNLESDLEKLNEWLGRNMRTIKLPELLIEVDNELKISKYFMSASQQDSPQAKDICFILATIIAQGCNIGSYTMSQLTGISYKSIKHISEWMFTDEALRSAMALVVNTISSLDITSAWGKGRTSSSDGQRFALKHKVLQQTYSHKFRDFALEFYSFIADNYAPFYSIPIECTDRDAPYVLDGLLYNESDLPLEEHYVDTHGYTENNFAAFAMLGKKFSPRIKGIKKQHIYRIDKDMDYQALTPLVCCSDRTINMEWIVDQWDRIGHFYASLESGHVTASTAMKRLNRFTGKNHFYRANRELGRIFKTEHILIYMSDKDLRQRTRRGLLKVEQLHALARDLNYGKRGQMNTRDFQEQRNSCSCLTLILACIIYWQAKEFNRIILDCDPDGNNINLKLIEHISPITWNNVILYGEYRLDTDLVRL